MENSHPFLISVILVLAPSVAGNSSWAFKDNQIPTPNFLPREQNITVEAGQTAELLCGVQNLGTKTVAWRKNSPATFLTLGDRRLTDDRRVTVRRDNENDWDLVISDTRESDSGYYECVVVRTEEYIYYRVYLNVIQDNNDSMVTSLTGSILVQEGSTIQVICNLTGSPLEDIEWVKNGEQLNTTSHVTKYSSSASKMSKLTIENCLVRDSGIYECRSSNQMVQTFNFHVEGKVTTTTPLSATTTPLSTTTTPLPTTITSTTTTSETRQGGTGEEKSAEHLLSVLKEVHNPVLIPQPNSGGALNVTVLLWLQNILAADISTNEVEFLILLETSYKNERLAHHFENDTIRLPRNLVWPTDLVFANDIGTMSHQPHSVDMVEIKNGGTVCLRDKHRVRIPCQLDDLTSDNKVTCQIRLESTIYPQRALFLLDPMAMYAMYSDASTFAIVDVSARKTFGEYSTGTYETMVTDVTFSRK